MKIRRLDLENADSANIDSTLSGIASSHAEFGLPPIEHDIAHASEHPLLKIASYLVFAILTSLIFYFSYQVFFDDNKLSGSEIVGNALEDPMFWSAVAVGLLAQVIDGALGMAYGITASSFLLAVGASPAMASGATHLAEVFTTGVSGVSHLKMGNVNKKLFFSLLIPGILGALIGTYILGNIDGKALKPYISAYLLLMGLYVLSKAFGHIKPKREINIAKIAPLALFGSFMDTTGGGGWGPIVTTTLVGSGHDPRTTIGSVNFAEFFLTVTAAAALFSILDHTVWVIVAGLVVGGLFAAPFAAYITKHIKTKSLLILVGSLISFISIFNLYKAF